MLYVIGLDSDRTFRYFVSQTRNRQIPLQVVNLRAVIANGDWHLSLPDTGDSWIDDGEGRIELDSHGAYYCRILDLSSVQSEIDTAVRWRELTAGISAWLEHIPGIVVNRPGGRADNFSKPLHEYLIQAAGFQVPPSLTSSDATKLATFAEAGTTIVKPVSGIRADTRLVTPKDFTDFQPHQGPVHLQRYIPGADVRAHVIGNSVHAELIDCPTDVDYRFAHEEAEYMAWELPPDLSAQIIQATAKFGMIFAGWDFKVTPDGQYWCLEANPMPGYDGYDRRADGKITDSLLQFLSMKQATTSDLN
jgi:glutathione synthase/RimK-type ligase-like ATP-grasp enzyme